MARASTSSIGLTPPTLRRALRRWLARELVRLQPVIAQNARACQADRYRKHFDTLTHTCLLLFHGLSGSPSLRQSYAAFPECRQLASLCGWREDQPSVSYAQFAASNSSRPPAFLAGLLPALLQRVRQSAPNADLPLDLQLLDATRLRLPRGTASWQTCHNGVGIQVIYCPARDLPERVVVMRDEKTKDYQGMDQAILEDPATCAQLRDQTLAFDLGYHSHDRFRRLLEAGIHLVTRYYAQARLEELEDLPVQQPFATLPQARIQVLADQRVLLGSPNNRRTKRRLVLRMVTATVAPLPRAKRLGAQTITYRILTDRFDLDAIEVIQLYLHRWQIELFFRWLKRVIKLVQPLGTKGREVVALSVWLAVLLHLLTVLAAHALGLPRRTPLLPFLFRALLCTLTPSATDHLPSPVQLPLFPPGFS